MRSAQQQFIDCLNAVDQGWNLELDQALRVARFALTKLKFTAKQINQIAKRRTLIKIVPIVSAWSGQIMRVTPLGAHVRAGAELFAVADRRVVMFQAPDGVDEAELAQLTVARGPERGDFFLGEFAGEAALPVVSAGRWFMFAFDGPAPPCGAEVVLEQPPPPPPPPPTDQEELAAGRCPPHLRGWPYTEYRRKLDPNYMREPGKVSRAAQAPSLEAWQAAQWQRLRAEWRASSFLPMQVVAAEGAGAPIDLEFSIMDWHRQAIETAPVEVAEFRHTWRGEGIVATLPPPVEAGIVLRAPVAGRYDLAALQVGAIVLPGAVLARLIGDGASPCGASAVQKGAHAPVSAPAAAPADANALTVGHRCVVVEALPTGAPVGAGAILAHLQALPTAIVRVWIAPACFGGFSAQPAARLIRPADRSLVSMDLPLVVVNRAGQRGYVEAFVPLPPGAPAWRDGWAIEVNLSERSTARRALSAPRDCVVLMGKSPEVLVHTDRGRLTRRRVRVGREDGERIELLAGVAEGEALVRHLPDRVRYRFPRFTAAMVGIWSLTGGLGSERPFN